MCGNPSRRSSLVVATTFVSILNSSGLLEDSVDGFPDWMADSDLVEERDNATGDVDKTSSPDKGELSSSEWRFSHCRGLHRIDVG